MGGIPLSVNQQIESIDQVQETLKQQLYIADRSLATSIFLALKLGKPLFLEGEAGVGKTEIAKVLAAMLDRRLIRLQCYEGLDVSTAVYEWNYTRQMLEIRLLEAAGRVDEQTALRKIFGPEFLLKRPLLQAIERIDGMEPVLRRCAARASLEELTNKPQQPSLVILDGLGLAPYFRWVIGGDSPFGRKPDPSGLRELMARAGADPARTLLVGDSRIDVGTGRRAGVRVCAARYGFGVLDEDALSAAAWIIDAPGEIDEVLDRCFADH